MALKFISYLWNVIKEAFWDPDEDGLVVDDVPRSESKNNPGRISRGAGDSYVRRASNYDVSCSEYETDDFLRYFIEGLNSKYPRRDFTLNDGGYRNQNNRCSNAKYRSDKRDFECHCSGEYYCICKDYGYYGESYPSYEDQGYEYFGYNGFDRRYYDIVDGNKRPREGIPQAVHFKEIREDERIFGTEYDFNEGIYKNNQRIKGDGTADKLPTSSLSLQNDHDFMRNLLFNFYELLHKCLCHKLSLTDGDIERALERLIFNYKNLNKCKTPEALDFNDMATCVGYLHRYAICHAALVYHSVTELLSASPLFSTIFSRRKLNMMCLGCGPGNDFIGFAFALLNSRIKISTIDVTVVDLCSGWSTVFSETIDMFNSLIKDAYKKPSKTFIQADLTDFSTWSLSMKKRLNAAHIVSLVKVLSNISEDDHRQTLRNIVGLMKDGAFLIIIDCPLPLTELSALSHFLLPVYCSGREKFNFKEKKTRFGYPNISHCTAYIRVYKKRNSVQFR